MKPIFAFSAWRYCSYFVPVWTATTRPFSWFGLWIPFGLPAFTMSTRCDSMYDTAGACFVRSGVMKMPLITASHFFAASAARRPGNAVFDATAVAPHVAASFVAMSTSKPMILPLVVVYSIGGNVGSVQYLNVAFAEWRFAPAEPAAARATSRASTESSVSA